MVSIIFHKNTPTRNIPLDHQAESLKYYADKFGATPHSLLSKIIQLLYICKIATVKKNSPLEYIHRFSAPNKWAHILKLKYFLSNTTHAFHALVEEG